LNEKVAAPVYKTGINGRRNPLTMQHSLPVKVGINFADRSGRSIGRVRLLTKSHGLCMFVMAVIMKTKFTCYLLHAVFLLGSFFGFKMEAKYSSETSVDFNGKCHVTFRKKDIM
jgi:hypothetical protein